MDTPRASSKTDPSRSGSQTPTPMPSDPPMTRDPDECRALTLQVYKEVWDEFNKWKVENCEQQLLLLQKPLPPPSVAEDTLLEQFNLRDGSEPGEVEIIYLCESEDDIPLYPGGSTVLMCETVHLELPPDFEPHPRYEFCTPSVQSIAFRPGSAAEAELDILPFVPYADDPTFDAKEYLGTFKWFAWEDLVDPDVEVIQFETLRRLRFGHELSLPEIDATDVLPPLRQSNREGLIYKMSQRDELFWPGMLGDDERPRIDTCQYEPDVDNLRGRLDSIVPYFCAHPSCIQAFCPQHVLPSLPVPPAAPRVTSKDYPKGDSCGSMCFREIDDTFMEDSVEWAEPDIAELLCILEIIPDTLPCGLAKLVRKPCREVYMQRRRLIPDDKVYPESAQPLKIRIAKYKDERAKEDKDAFEHYLAPGPCSHTGPCEQSNPDCTCAAETVHCSRSCRCGLTCRRRWAGCGCRRWRKTRTCTKACGCMKRGWECDPLVCECDNANSSKTSNKKRIIAKKPLPRKLAPDGEHFCENSDIQRGLAAKIEIKRGMYGLGAFAVNGIRKGKFIGEYVGEMVPTKSHEREILRTHVDLNYNFGYNPDVSLDSARVGNETRYINHGSDAERLSNAVADTKLVFGEHRIGLWATRNIKKGEEILFDYGENYWKDKEKKASV